tara:strand:- start:139 stop:630 length:492 start_codon:yes stop_codon:yes gene_type:complete
MSTIVQKLRRLVRNGDPKNEAQGLELLFQCAEENPALVAEVLFPLEIIWYWASPQRHRCIFGKLDTWEPGVWTELYRQWLMEDESEELIRWQSVVSGIFDRVSHPGGWPFYRHNDEPFWEVSWNGIGKKSVDGNPAPAWRRVLNLTQLQLAKAAMIEKTKIPF